MKMDEKAVNMKRDRIFQMLHDYKDVLGIEDDELERTKITVRFNEEGDAVWSFNPESFEYFQKPLSRILNSYLQSDNS